MPSPEVVFTGRKFRVEAQQVTLADGAAFRMEVIRHPGAAVILPLLPDGRILFIDQLRRSIGRRLLELPAGTLDDGEDPAECARRELAEETGYVAGEIQPLVDFYSTPGICDERMIVFVATRLTAGPAAPEPQEDIRICPMEYEEALRATRNGRIRDAKSLVGLLYFDRFRRDA